MKATQIVTSQKVGGPSSAELERKHLEFDEVLDDRLDVLFNFLYTFHDIVYTVGGEELLLKVLEEFIEGGVRAAVGIHIPCLGATSKEKGGDAGLVRGRDARKVHVFIDTVDPLIDSVERHIQSVEILRLGNLKAGDAGSVGVIDTSHRMTR